MRILWFCNTPGQAKAYLKDSFYGGGWIDALQLEIEEEGKHELGLVFYSNQEMEPFNYRRTSYFPVKRLFSNKLKRLYYRYTSKVEYDENLDRFVEIIREFKPDVINVFGTENPFGLIVKRVKDVPVVIWIQGNLTVYSFKFFSGITKYADFNKLSWVDRNKIMLQFNEFRQKAKIEREMLKECPYIIGRTDWDRRISRVLAPKSSYLYVNDVARPAFYQNRWGYKKKDKFTCFTTTGTNLYKGFETIVNAAIELTQLGFNFQWNVAGIKAEDSITKLAMRSRGVKNLADIHINLVGVIPEEGLIRHMLEADAYIQVSHIENNPNSLFEAMLLGMPIIASHAGGSGNLVENNLSGWLIQEGDPINLAGAIIEMSENPELMQELGQNAYDKAYEIVEPKDVYKDLIHAYEVMLESKSQKIPVKV
jgi:glycosyltransferase involved in cell wall biosynthesis